MNDMAWAIRNMLMPGLDNSHGVLVVFQSFHAGRSWTFKAVPHESRGEAETQEGFSIVMHVESFRFPVDVVDVNTGAVLDVMPQLKDKITTIDDAGNPLVYYDILQEAGQRAVEYGDAQRTTYRVHVKQIAAPVQTQVMYGNANGIAYGNADPDGVAYGNSPRN